MSELLKAKVDALVEALQDALERISEIERTYREMPEEAKAELEVDPKEIENLPWRPYREGHRSGWIFSNQSGAERLAEAIRSSHNGRIEIRGFEYRFSGDQDKFISRRPVKE